MTDRLTTAYRRDQLALRSRAVRSLSGLWKMVDPTNLTGTIGPFADAATEVADRGHRESGNDSVDYYKAVRQGARVASRLPSIRPAELPPQDVVTGALRGAALGGIVGARRAGKTLDQAGKIGFVQTAGALIKLVLTGGRMTIINASATDPAALGWQRVTSGDPCAFCRMVAGRGPVYASQRSADFTAHDTCGCTVRPVYDETLDTQTQLWVKQYRNAQTWAKTNVDRKERTDNDALNNLRLYVAAGAPDMP